MQLMRGACWCLLAFGSSVDQGRAVPREAVKDSLLGSLLLHRSWKVAEAERCSPLGFLNATHLTLVSHVGAEVIFDSPSPPHFSPSPAPLFWYLCVI